jgi:hypothetical protein
MATPSNKPRDIKNLKARLGRTITPGQAGTPGAFPGTPGSAPVPGASVPPPVMGGGFPGAPAGGTGAPGLPAPGGIGGLGGAAPGSTPFGRPLPAPSAAVRPPLGGQSAPAGAASGQPAARQSVPGAAPSARVDPFAAASGAQVAAAKRVTLVIDDSAVKDDEIGRKSRGRTIGVATVCILLGIGVGFGVGNTADRRSQYSAAVRDGKEIYNKIQEVSKSVDSAKDLLKKAVDASSGGPGKKAAADFPTIEQLVALKRPFSANEFHRRLYRAFGNNVVDELFDYYNNVNLLWDGFTALGAKTAGQGRHDALTKSAAATDGLLNTDYGLVLSKNGDMFAGGLVFLSVVPQQPPAADAKPEKKGKKKSKEVEGIKAKVSSQQGGQEVERTLFTGQTDVGESFEKYVFMVDKVRSRSILGESANLFAKFRADLVDLNGRMDKTTEVQGRLIKDLGPIASMSE